MNTELKKEYLDFLYEEKTNVSGVLNILKKHSETKITNEERLKINSEIKVYELYVYTINHSINKFLELF